MAGKRRATSDLNHDNWNQEEDPEDSGSFKRASHDELKKRVIKTARRRLPASSEVDPNEKSAFANFTGLSRTPARPSNDPSSSNQKNLSILLEKLKDKGSEKSEVGSNNIFNMNGKEEYSDKTISQESIPTTNEKINGKSSTEELDGSNTTENIDNQVDNTNGKISAEAGNEITESKTDASDAINIPEEVQTNPINLDTNTEVAKDERKKREGSSEISEKKDAKNN